MAAAKLYEQLEQGYYRDQNQKRHRIAGDMSKLRFAEGITPQQKQILADVRFRTRNLSGTQEIRCKLGHICFWGSVVYGNGIFMTISPSERHNYLAIKLCRYRRRDPYLFTANQSPSENWIGPETPKLEATESDRFNIEVPGYDMRNLMLAQDPLCCVLAFATQVRVQLATLFGIRMCPRCPHCATSSMPCSDAFGSNAELMGGLGGRSDGLCGTVECQKKRIACIFIFGIIYNELINTKRSRKSQHCWNKH